MPSLKPVTPSVRTPTKAQMATSRKNVRKLLPKLMAANLVWATTERGLQKRLRGLGRA